MQPLRSGSMQPQIETSTTVKFKQPTIVHTTTKYILLKARHFNEKMIYWSYIPASCKLSLFEVENVSNKQYLTNFRLVIVNRSKNVGNNIRYAHNIEYRCKIEHTQRQT